MESIIKSLRPMSLLVAGTVVFALGTVFLLASDATLASSSSSSSDLGQGGRWLQFLAGACLLGAVCTAGWEAILRSDWIAGAEVAAAALGTLLLTIALAAVAASNGPSSAAAVTSAIGVGVWALLVLSRAARFSLAEQGAAYGAGPGRRSDLWLAAAVGLFTLALGYGFSSAAGSTGPALTAGLLQAAGLAALAGAVATARSRQMLASRPVPAVLAGLALLAVSFLAAAIVAGAEFQSLNSIAASASVVTAVELAGVVALGLAGWTRVRELHTPPAGQGTGSFVSS